MQWGNRQVVAAKGSKCYAVVSPSALHNAHFDATKYITVIPADGASVDEILKHQAIPQYLLLATVLNGVQASGNWTKRSATTEKGEKVMGITQLLRLRLRILGGVCSSDTDNRANAAVALRVHQSRSISRIC